jgi:membrane associated rhomboid family serine protease
MKRFASVTIEVLYPVLGFVALCWLVSIINWLVFGGRLVAFGIQPREFAGLLGVVWSPLLHANWGHLISNSLPFIVLGGLVLLRDRREFWSASIIIWLCSGLGTWLLGGNNTVHVGASGLVFGYFGLLVARGWFARDIWSVLMALAVFLVYGGLIWGVFPLQQGVSWQGHLMGLLGGVLAARLLTISLRQA